MTSLMWYKNPAWYALAAALFSLIISMYSYFTARRTLKHNIQRGLVQQAATINEQFIKYKVKGPFAHHLAISDAKVESFTAKAVLLLNQINLLRDVYDNQKLLAKETVDSYKQWACTIVRPWIEADEELRQVWELTRTSKDWQGKSFILWLDDLFPIIQKPKK